MKNFGYILPRYCLGEFEKAFGFTDSSDFYYVFAGASTMCLQLVVDAIYDEVSFFCCLTDFERRDEMLLAALTRIQDDQKKSEPPFHSIILDYISNTTPIMTNLFGPRDQFEFKDVGTALRNQLNLVYLPKSLRKYVTKYCLKYFINFLGFIQII
jgi:hypothetical protein